MFDIANQLLSCQSPFAPLVQVDEWTAKSLRFSFGRDFVGLCLLKCWKNRIAYGKWRSNFLEPKYENKNWNLRFQWLWWQHLIISTEIDIVRFATGRFQPSTSKISSFSKDKVDLWEIFTLKITPIVVFVAIQRIVLSWALASTHFTILIRGMSIVLLSFVNEVGFSFSEGLLRLYNIQNDKWLLVDKEFLFSCSTRHLTRKLSSWTLEKKFYARPSIFSISHVLFWYMFPLSITDFADNFLKKRLIFWGNKWTSDLDKILK